MCVCAAVLAQVQRREALGRFATAAAALVFAPALPARAAKGPARNTKATAEDTVAAVATLRAAKEQLKSIGDKVEAPLTLKPNPCGSWR